MKSKRQEEILRIIEEVDVETQDQLLEHLKERGVSSTQATISRDIKELHLIKELTGFGTYKYVVSERKTSLNFAGRLRTIFKVASPPSTWPRTSWSSKPCPALPPPPARPWTAWRYRIWWAVWPVTIRPC